MTTAELREIDARIHREVMGGVIREVRIMGSTETVTVYTDNPAFSDGHWSKRELLVSGACPHYSTDIAAAWQVVERMCGPDYMVARFDHGGGTTRCGFYTVHAGRLIAVANADSAPLAICLAALEAVSTKETSPPQKGDCNA